MQLLEKESMATHTALYLWRNRKMGKDLRRSLPLHPDHWHSSDRVYTHTHTSISITQWATFGLTHKWHSHTASHLTASGNPTWVRSNKTKSKLQLWASISKKLNKFRMWSHFPFWEIKPQKTTKDSCHGYSFSAKGRTLLFIKAGWRNIQMSSQNTVGSMRTFS